MRLSSGFIICVGISFVVGYSVHAQVERPLRSPGGTLPGRGDTLRPANAPSINKNDTLIAPVDSVRRRRNDDVETTIIYSARDSIKSNVQKKIVRLYGNAKIKYGEIELEAEEIEIDYEHSTIHANGILDSIGQRVGYPIFKNGQEVYETRDMIYNFKTRQARISEVVTQQGDGYLHGEKVFKNDKNELFSIGNAYTTCNLAHPHFRIISTRSKAIPGDKIISGPFYMEFNDVPTPLGFAFAIFPSQRKSSSGILFPTYGEEKTRGFFMRNGGYFFDISDYMKLAVTGDIYSKGSSALQILSNYRKRYHYGGAFNFSFTNNRLSQNIEDKSTSKDFRVTWSHSPQTKGTGRFSASVNAATATFNNNNYLAVNANQASNRLDNTTRKLTSNVSYSKTFAGSPFSVGVNLRHNQDLQTKQVDLPLPDVSFNMSNIYPFKSSNSDFLQNIAFRLTSNGTNYITNNLGKIKTNQEDQTDSIAPFSFENLPTFLQNSRKGVKHNFPLATSIKLFKHFTLSPSLTYDELWYFEKLDWGWNGDSTRLVVRDTIDGFNRISNYSGGVSVTTRIYGTWVSKKKDSKIKAIRHVINPSVNYSLQPDFAAPQFDYYQKFTSKTGVTYVKSRHEGFVYGSSRQGRSSAIGFGINNNLEMKVQSEKDTVDRKISLLNTLSINSNYNLAADSFRLSNIAMSANTSVLGDKINLNVSASIDPYQYRLISINEVGTVTQRKVDEYVWRQKFRLGQISSANFALSTNLSPAGRKKDQSTRDKIAKSNISDTDKDYLMKNPDAYIDFSIPWNLRISYNLDYTKQGYSRANVTQAIRFSGDISLTEKWKADFNSGYDMQQKKFTQSSFGLRRDLHCWQMSVNWVPFGRFQSYNFTIGVKSGMLRDLKLDRQRSFFDNL